MSLRNAIKAVLWHPGQVHYGRNSWIKRPVHFENCDRITLGDNVLIRGYGYMAVVREWAGVTYNGHIRIGSGTYIGRYFYATALDAMEIGEHCVLSEHVYLSDHGHGVDPRGGPIMQQPLESKGAVRIGNHCFLGYRSTVLSGVTLGDNCVVGAHSLVTRSFPAGSMVAGAPARLLKRWDGDRWTPSGDQS